MAERKTLANQQDFVRILWYGEPGTGKTSNSAALARLGKVIHVAADPGLKARPLVELGIPVQNIEVHDDITFTALDELFWDIKELIAAGGDDAPVGVLWDSISEAHKKLLEQTAAIGYEKARKAGKERERLSIHLEDYGTNSGQMRYLMRRFLDLECHVGFAALTKREQDQNTGYVTYGPDMTPKLAQDLLGYVDVVCKTEVHVVDGHDEPEYWRLFRPVNGWSAKDRFHALPPRLINPTFDRVIAYVNGEMDAESDPDMEAARERRRSKDDK